MGIETDWRALKGVWSEVVVPIRKDEVWRQTAQVKSLADALLVGASVVPAAHVHQAQFNKSKDDKPVDAFHKERLICTEKQVISAIPT
jgi:hypothetical protein